MTLHCAVLCCAALCCIVLCCVVLCCVVLCCVVLGWVGLGWVESGCVDLGFVLKVRICLHDGMGFCSASVFVMYSSGSGHVRSNDMVRTVIPWFCKRCAYISWLQRFAA